jgi:hypothetical protein
VETDQKDEYEKELSKALKSEGKEEAIERAISLGSIAQKGKSYYRALIRLKGSLAFYNELKRHRTISMKVESVYKALERFLESGEHFVPKELGKFREEYESVVRKYKEAFEGKKVVELSSYIPQFLKLLVEVELSLDQLLAPFLFFNIRSCLTAEFEMRERVREIVEILEKQSKLGMKGRLISLLKVGNVLIPKCRIGYCFEPSFRACGLIDKIRMMRTLSPDE